MEFTTTFIQVYTTAASQATMNNQNCVFTWLELV